MQTEAIRLFVLAAEKLNISAAGKKLDMAPAVASSKLAKLEKQLGVELLHRSTRKVSLSLEGAEFLFYAKEMLAQEAEALAALGKGKSEVSGTLRFTAPSTFAQLYIAPILPDFLDQNPNIDLDLRLSDARFDLIEGSFDLALRNARLEDTSLKGRKLADDVRLLCASPNYLETHGVPRTPDDLSEHQLMLFQGQPSLKLITKEGEGCDVAPILSKYRVSVDDGLSQKLLTMSGAGISINSLWSVHKELKEGTLVRVLPDYVANHNSVLWLVYPKSNVLTPKVRVFMDFILERLGRNPPWLGL
ncbi:LysR family transcriptional regulator [Roseibium sp. TrichSKD4]|uniref:LysR family transcriptional regulator n=1 Tax=Roseibium sp. TrichSKD4 TaxID=744980 RepID=UPI0001E563C2|nr:LysR family transcriptional regulator [Roseibium sp. TrichSKD4]EFO33060.1 LysR family transcriptional regulator [Roseibium sp. TrichSKD4]